MEGIIAVCHAFQMQSSQQQNQNSTRSTGEKQCKAPLNLTLKNQISLTVPYVQITCSMTLSLYKYSQKFCAQIIVQ